MKADVQYGVPGDRLADRLPPWVRDRLLRGIIHTEAHYTVVVFPEGKVVHSGILRRAIDRVDPAEQIVVAAHDLTREARALIVERKGMAITHGEFGWTDESYLSLP